MDRPRDEIPRRPRGAEAEGGPGGDPGRWGLDRGGVEKSSFPPFRFLHGPAAAPAGRFSSGGHPPPAWKGATGARTTVMGFGWGGSSTWSSGERSRGLEKECRRSRRPSARATTSPPTSVFPWSRGRPSKRTTGSAVRGGLEAPHEPARPAAVAGRSTGDGAAVDLGGADPGPVDKPLPEALDEGLVALLRAGALRCLVAVVGTSFAMGGGASGGWAAPLVPRCSAGRRCPSVKARARRARGREIGAWSGSACGASEGVDSY